MLSVCFSFKESIIDYQITVDELGYLQTYKPVLRFCGHYGKVKAVEYDADQKKFYVTIE